MKDSFWLGILVIVILGSLSISHAHGATYFVKIYPEMDTYVRQDRPLLPHYDEPYLETGYFSIGDFPVHSYTLLKFDMSEIPHGATIRYGYLKMHLQEGGMTSTKAERITEPWDETAVNWNTKPGISADTVEVWSPTFRRYLAIPLDVTADIGSPPGPSSWNMTIWAQKWFTGALPNYGIVLMPENEREESYSKFYSSEYLANYAYRPYLDISYTYEGPPPVTSPTPLPEPPDSIPPTCQIALEPEHDISIYNRVTIQAQSTDNAGLQRMEILVVGSDFDTIREDWSTDQAGITEHTIPVFFTPMNPGRYTVTVRAWDRAAQEGTTSRHFEVLGVYGRPKLTILDIEPVTQAGSTLITGKQAIFKFKYLLDSDRPVNVTSRLELSPKRYWDTTLRPYSEDPETWIFHEVITLQPTAGYPRTAYLFETMEGINGTFLPGPKYKAASPLRVVISIDPFHQEEWDSDSILSHEAYFISSVPETQEWIKLVFFEIGGRSGDIRGAPRFSYSFTSQQKTELVNKLLAEPFFEDRPNPYRLYLSAIFPADAVVNPDGYSYWFTGKIGWWDADTLGEEAADEGYSRVIAITPPGAIAAEEGGGAIGVVYHRAYGRYDQSYYTAFVDFDEAVDSARYQYFPTVAHELSHTYRFPDIYGGDHQVVVDHDYVYFDEIKGGIVRIFKTDTYLSMATVPNPVVGRDLEPLMLPVYISANDIMDYAGYGFDNYWIQASYDQVTNRLTRGEDPPEGLVISMIVYPNGTVEARPFQKIYNHHFSYPQTDGEGNFSINLYSKDGTMLKSYPYTIDFYYTVEPFGEKPAEAMPLVTTVEWFENLGRIELRDSKGNTWYQRHVSEHSPQVQIIDPQEGLPIPHSSYTIRWLGSDEDGDTLWYTVLIRKSDTEIWNSLLNKAKETSMEFDPSSEYSEGSYTLQVKATDGVNTGVDYVNFSISSEKKQPPMTTTPWSIGIILSVNVLFIAWFGMRSGKKL